MTRSELENHLGEYVKITLFDNEVLFGYLTKTQDERFKNQPNLYIPHNRYFLTANKKSLNCETCLFKVSHIKKFVALNKINI